jgi:excisionase family DNA binding protein
MSSRKTAAIAAPLPLLDANRRYSVADALAYLGISKPTLYKGIRAGEVRVIKHGRRSFIPGSELVRLSA